MTRQRPNFMPYERRGAKTRLAKYMGCSKAYVSQMFNGTRPPSLKAAAMLELYFQRTGVPCNRWDMLYYRQHGEGIDHLVRRIIAEKKAHVYGKPPKKPKLFP